MINEKVWIIIYFFISFLQTLRDYAGDYINDLHSEGRITYRTRSRLKSGIVVSIESVHLIWQIYGNIIYFDQYDDKNIKQCREQINTGFISLMFMIILLGYFYFILYAIFMMLITGLYLRRMTNQRERSSQASRIIQSISRVKFSEDLFGAISDDNECIICMTPFKQDDMITKLDCSGNHFYHTSCIENWINQGSNQCPMCREPINRDI